MHFLHYKTSRIITLKHIFLKYFGVLFLTLGHFLAIAAAQQEAQTSKHLQIVTTTNLIGNISEVLCAADCTVRSLMGPGVDPHLYRPSPNDMRLLIKADLVFAHGLHLEGKMLEALAGLRSSGKDVIEVTKTIDSSALILHQFGTSSRASIPDPHIWFDLSLWKKVVVEISDTLVNRDPEHSENYKKRSTTQLVELDALDSLAKEEILKIPSSQRILVTAHDAFSYFGKRYGIEVHGVQGVSTDSETSLAAINQLIDVLVTKKVPAVFVESSVPPKSIEALVEGCRSRGHTVKMGGELYSDALGPQGSGAESFVEMFRHNLKTISAALQ